MPNGKEIRVNVRIAEELKDQIQRVTQLTGVDESALVRACLESIVEYFDANGEITLPLAVLPKSQLKKLKAAQPIFVPTRSTAPPDDTQRLNEDPAPIGGKPGPRAQSTKPGIAKTVAKGKAE